TAAPIARMSGYGARTPIPVGHRGRCRSDRPGSRSTTDHPVADFRTVAPWYHRWSAPTKAESTRRTPSPGALMRTANGAIPTGIRAAREQAKTSPSCSFPLSFPKTPERETRAALLAISFSVAENRSGHCASRSAFSVSHVTESAITAECCDISSQLAGTGFSHDRPRRKGIAAETGARGVPCGMVSRAAEQAPLYGARNLVEPGLLGFREERSCRPA